MLQIIICDDEPEVVDMISNQLDTIICSTIKYNCFKTTNPKKVVQWTRRYDIDLLLIDIDMPEMNGFETVRQARIQHNKTLIIFVTNMDLYVYESLKYRPFRFVRKSHMEEIEEAILSSILLLKGKNDNLIILNDNKQRVKVKVEDIIYFESLHNDVKIVTANGEFTYRATLKNIEKELEGRRFVRIHSAYLLNIKYIHLIKQKDVEICVCGSKKELPVSRARRNNLILEHNNNLR